MDYSSRNAGIDSLSLISTPSTLFQSITTDYLTINQSSEIPQMDQPAFNSTGQIIHSVTYFEAFTGYYSSVVHGYLSLCVCIFGIIANLVNILVLTR